MFDFNFFSLFDFRFFFLLNFSIVSLENLFFSFFVSLDLRKESPILNSRFRKSFFKNLNLFLVCSFGIFSDYITFPIFNFSIVCFIFLILLMVSLCIFVFYFLKIFFFLNW